MPLTAPPVPPCARDGAALRGLERPTVLDALRTLSSVVGAATALDLWARAATETGLHGTGLGPPEQLRLLEVLVGMAETAPARAAAVSVLTRLRAHRVLAAAERGA